MIRTMGPYLSCNSGIFLQNDDPYGKSKAPAYRLVIAASRGPGKGANGWNVRRYRIRSIKKTIEAFSSANITERSVNIAIPLTVVE